MPIFPNQMSPDLQENENRPLKLEYFYSVSPWPIVTLQCAIEYNQFVPFRLQEISRFYRVENSYCLILVEFVAIGQFVFPN
jgi:hypothetical protein